MIYIIAETNYTVTSYYFNILKQAAELSTKEVSMIDDIGKLNCNRSRDIIVVGSMIKAVKLFLKGYKNVIVWFQGVVPEESYMKHTSKIRKTILETIEKYVLKKSVLRIFVSEAMKDYYENKYNLVFGDKYYSMPCYNTEIQEESFFKDNKYSRNLFVYAGGLSVWQGFDRILQIYKSIESFNCPDTKLLVLTPDKEKARKIIVNTSIKNYEIDYVTIEQLPGVLSKAKFGFIVRDNNIVNQVATPTKLSTYLANGLIPIYSEILNDFHINTMKFTYKVSIDSIDYEEKIKSLMTTPLIPKDIFDEYNQLFQRYYNTELHKKNLSSKLKDIIKI